MFTIANNTKKIQQIQSTVLIWSRCIQFLNGEMLCQLRNILVTIRCSTELNIMSHECYNVNQILKTILLMQHARLNHL